MGRGDRGRGSFWRGRLQRFKTEGIERKDEGAESLADEAIVGVAGWAAEWLRVQAARVGEWLRFFAALRMTVRFGARRGGRSWRG
jgi:hypothetical protein